MRENTLLSNLRDDVGIVPYANGEVLPFSLAWFKVSGGLPSSVRAFGPATFPGGEGFLPAGVFYTRFVYPIRAWSTSLAQARPSVMAQTTRDWPRRQSPAAKILGFSVR